MRPLLRNIILASAAALGLAGCNDGYGYGGASYGWGTGYYDGYYGNGYYGSPYYGWYDGWYYPGSGYYVYDRGGARRNWNDGQRRYWEGRRGTWNGDSRPNWNGYRGNNNDARPPWRGRSDGNWQGRRDGNWNGNRGGGNWNRGSNNVAPRVTNPAPAESGRLGNILRRRD